MIVRTIAAKQQKEWFLKFHEILANLSPCKTAEINTLFVVFI